MSVCRRCRFEDKCLLEMKKRNKKEEGGVELKFDMSVVSGPLHSPAMLCFKKLIYLFYNSSKQFILPTTKLSIETVVS